MPVSWLPKRRTLQEQINEEFAKLEADKLRKGDYTPEEPWQPQMQPVAEPEVTAPVTPRAPTIQAPIRQAPMVQAPVPQLPKVEQPTEELAVPFWQRALQVFSAPFVWAEENIIKPGLSLIGTAIGAVPEVERDIGEDYWEWKKRSWEAWVSPGFEFNVPWSDEPARIDMKGVLEFAPWLLIPGAGQVGTGARAARGVAGLAGRFGTAGKVVGKAIEYSPWGIAEKTAGVAMKGAFKGVGKLTGRVSTKAGEKAFGKIPEPPPPTPTIRKLNSYMKEFVVPQREAFEAVKHQIPVAQRSLLDDLQRKVWSGEITATRYAMQAKKILKGTGLKPDFSLPKGVFTYRERNEIYRTLVDSAEKGHVTMDTATAMRETLLKGTLPEPRHLPEWAKVFGKEFADTIKTISTVDPSLMGKITDALNLPRSVMASLDISAVARQGAIFGMMRPTQIPRNFGRMIKSLFSEKAALELDDIMRADPLFREFLDVEGYIAPISKQAMAGVREEAYLSRFAENVPFVRRSERAFITYLNEARFGAYKSARNAWMAQGATQEELKVLARFINLASGRGDLPANLNQYAPLLNTILFSPRLQMSRLQLPRQLGRMLLSKNPYMRKEAARALVTFVGGGAGIVTLASAMSGNKAVWDPRSGEFGKIKIGDTRLDIWTGYAQYGRFLGQFLTGERKSAYGNLSKDERWNIAFRFLQGKSSPAAGLFVDLLKGEDYMGEPLFEGTTGFIETARNRLLPLALQDVIDAVEEGGVNGMWTGIPAAIGVGTLTYVNDLVRIRERIARDAGFDSWDDIDPKKQREIENSSTELQIATIKFDRQMMGRAWSDWRLAGNAIEDVFRENVDLATSQFRKTGDGYQFREKVGDAFTARRGGYDARNAMPQFEDIVKRLNIQDVVEADIALGPEQLAIKIYNDTMYGDDMYDEFGDYRFDEAEIRRQQLIQELGQERFDYVEDYRGLKYTGFPPEYQELAKAKIVLRPYWQVKDELIKIRGKPKTPYQIERLSQLVSRIRKRMRGSDPEIAKYYELFYVRPPK